MAVTRIDQRMATAAAAILPGDEDLTGELRTRYRQLSSMLHSAGLAATYAYVASKAGDPSEHGLKGAYGRVREGLERRLEEIGLLAETTEGLRVRDVMTRLGNMGPVEYARASAEAAELVEWLSRLANAVIAEKGTADDS